MPPMFKSSRPAAFGRRNQKNVHVYQKIRPEPEERSNELSQANIASSRNCMRGRPAQQVEVMAAHMVRYGRLTGIERG